MDVSFANDQNRRNPFKEGAAKILNKVKNWKVPASFYYFLILIFVGIGFYFYMLAENNFSLAYGGDYSAQYIPMAYHVWDYYHEWINTGHFALFDQTIYLGVNSFGSNAYYGLFSPFNIIIVLSPRVIVPQMMAVTSIIKLACAGLFFSIYMKHAFKVKDSVSRICGVAYAFAGWGAFYLWYNNYQDILVFFPLVLLGIEKTVQEKKPWILCVGVFFLAICNYVLCVPYIICGFFYAMFRFFQTIRTRNVKDNFIVLGFGVLGFAGGILMSMMVFGPAIMATLSSPKLDTYSYFGELKKLLTEGKAKEFFGLLFSWKNAPDQHNYKIPERAIYPILEFFVPSSTCRSLPSLQMQSWDFDDNAVSLWSYVPFIMFLVPALIQSGKEKKWSHFIGFTLMVFILFTPFMYFLTMLGTSSYARWTLFVITSLLAYVGIYIDKIPNVARWHIHVGAAFAILGVVASWIITNKLNTPVEGNGMHVKFMHRFVAYDDNGNFLFNFTNLFFILEIVYIVGVYLTFFFIYYKKAFQIVCTAFISFEAIFVGNFVTWGHGYDQGYNNGYGLNERFRTVLNRVKKGDKSFYRVYTSIGDDWSVNNSMMNGYGSGSYFHSLYNFEVDDFTLWTGMRTGSRSVGGHYRGKYQDVDNLLGVKYYFISKSNKKSKYYEIEESFPGNYMANVPFGFEENKEYTGDSEDFIVYENSDLNTFGYSYSTLYDAQLYKNASQTIEVVRNGMHMSTKASVSPDDGEEITEKYSDITVDSQKATFPSLRQLTMASSYTCDYYDIWEETNHQTLAKNYKLGKIPDIPNDFTKTTYRLRDDYGSTAQRYFGFYKSRTAGQPIVKKDTLLYIYAPFSGSEKYNFYFIDEDNKIFMMDAHDDDTTDNTAAIRGFYVRKDTYAIAVCGKYDESHFFDSYGAEKILLYKEDKADYDLRLKALNADPVKNIEYSADKFTFTTKYDNNKFVVSHVAFDSGWTIVAKNNETGKTENIKTYKGNGGFVSFVAPKGDYSYTMTYQTPYLNISYVVTAFATASFFISLLGYHVYQSKKKPYYLDGIFRENY